MDTMTLEQLLKKTPASIDTRDEGRMFLHLQPTLYHDSWNAFYGNVQRGGPAIHPFLFTKGKSPYEALVNINNMLTLFLQTLEPNPDGLDEASITTSHEV